jgi:arylsulfatase A-like enzyme
MAVPTERPNVVLITCHDLGRHLGCYDRGVETPNIDAMAAAGILFEEAFCTAPQCSPSRGSIITGQYPHQHGLLGLAHLGWRLEEPRTLPRVVGDAGYDTHLFGFQHETTWEDATTVGYDHDHNTTAAPKVHGRARPVAEKFAESLPELAADGPFFTSLGFDEPHGPFRRDYVEDGAYDRYDAESVPPLPHTDSTEDYAEALANYNSLLTATTDRAVGRVREALREHGLAEDTVLLFTTDHGVPFPDAKGSCTDAGQETALIAERPGVYDGGERRSATVQNVDLLPTLCDLTGATVPEGVVGESFRPILEGECDDGHERLFFEITWHESPKPSRAVRTDRFKYIRNFRPRFDATAADPVREEFYDLEADPHERHNLLRDPDAREAHGETIDALRDDLRDWMRETGDPLASGSIPMPHQDRDWFDP